MPRPDLKFLDPARYPFQCSIDTRFADLDLNHHVNNVALAQICEEGRIRFHQTIGYAKHRGNARTMVASVSLEYLAEANHPAPIVLHTAIVAMGRTSHTLAVLAMQGDRAVAFSQAVLVAVSDSGPVPISEDFRAQMSPWMIAV